MENGALFMAVVAGVFFLFADPIENAGLDWRGAVVSACDWVVGKDSID